MSRRYDVVVVAEADEGASAEEEKGTERSRKMKLLARVIGVWRVELCAVR